MRKLIQFIDHWFHRIFFRSRCMKIRFIVPFYYGEHITDGKSKARCIGKDWFITQKAKNKPKIATEPSKPYQTTKTGR